MVIKTLNKTLLYSLALSLCTYQSLNADTDDWLAALENDMTHFENVATVTKENELYQPYVISTFSGKDLEKLGIVNLEEALGLIPGVDMATNNFDIKTPVFRGSNPQAFGQSKLFIDGVPANNVIFDAYSEYMRLPTEMIKRIEVVRGPGSKTDGYNAYAGSINVITYAENIDGFGDGDSVVMKGGSYKYGMLGFIKSYELDNFRLTTDFFYQQDDKVLKSGLDGVRNGYSGSVDGNEDGDFDDAGWDYDNRGVGASNDALMWSKTYSLGATLIYKDNFYAKLRLMDHTQGGGHGTNNYATDEKSSRDKYPNHYLELGYKDSISDFDVSVNAGVKYDAFDHHSENFPDGLSYYDVLKFNEYRDDDDNTTDYIAVYLNPITYPDGQHTISIAEQITYYQSSFVEYNKPENHNIKLGYRVSQEKTTNVVSKATNYSTGVGIIDVVETRPFFNKDAKRDTFSIFLQDSYTYSDSLSFLLGFNYEKTTLTEAQYEPKASLVYQPDRSNIFKLLYSKSHRNPSWQETFAGNQVSRQGSESFGPEKVEAYEAAYVYKIDTSRHLQSNVFYLKNSDQLQVIDTTGHFGNVGETNIFGLELEYKGYIGSNDMFYLNYSYIDGEETNTDYLSNIAQHMAKGYYSYDITREFSLSTVMKYIGKKERSETDGRTEPLKSYSKVDLTARYDNEKYDYSLMASVKNVFDSDIRFASKEKTYDDDYYQEGRNFMITLKKEF